MSRCSIYLPAIPDYGKRVAAFYFWLFPNLMLNFYPWGLSMNVVNPLGYVQNAGILRIICME